MEEVRCVVHRPSMCDFPVPLGHALVPRLSAPAAVTDHIPLAVRLPCRSFSSSYIVVSCCP
jgi:hypothetical protein